MKFTRKISSLVGVVCLGLISAQAPAAIVTVYGDDLSFTYDDSTLYGAANVVGNNVFFLPSNFSAESLNGGVDITNEVLEILIQVTTPGFILEDFALAEQGDYYLDGVGATAAVTGNFTVASNTSVYADTDVLSAGPLLVQGAYTDWNIDSTIMLSDTVGWGGETSVLVTLENTLTATTLVNGEQAFIEKKIGAIGVMVNEVPVPAAVWLFGSGLIGLAGLRRRRSS